MLRLIAFENSVLHIQCRRNHLKMPRACLRQSSGDRGRFQIPALLDSQNKTAQYYHSRLIAKMPFWQRSVQILLEMCAEIKTVDVNSYNLVIESCGVAKEVDRARDVFQLMNSHQVKPDIQTFKILMTAYKMKNDWKSSCQLLDEMRDEYDIEPDVPLYSSAIRTCQKAEQYEKLFDIYNKMISNNIQPNLPLLNTMLMVCFSTSQWETMIKIHDSCVELSSDSLKPNSKTLHLIAGGHAKLGDSKKSRHYFNKIIESGAAPDRYVLNFLLHAYADNLEHEKALELIKLHSVRDVVDADHYCTLMRAYSEAGLHAKVVQVVDMMEADGVKPNVKSLDLAIFACSHLDQWVNALELFDTILRSNMKPTHQSFNGAITACAKSGQWDKAVKFLFMMEGYGLEPQQESYGASIYGCAKAREFVTMFKILNSMEKRNIVPDLHCLNSVLYAFAKIGYARDAIDFLKTMRQMGVEPDVISYTSAIGACDRGDQWQSALHLIDEMMDAGLTPNVRTITVAMSACKKRGKFEEALELFEKLLAMGVEPDIHCYTSLIGACRAKRNTQAALEIVDRMNKSGLKVDVIAYRTICNILSRDKSIGAMLALVEHMNERGLEPDDAIISNIIVCFDLLHRDAEAREFLNRYRVKFKTNLKEGGTNSYRSNNHNNKLMHLLWTHQNEMDLTCCTKAVGRAALGLLMEDFISGRKEPCDFMLKTQYRFKRYKYMLPPELNATFASDNDPRNPKDVVFSKQSVEKWLENLNVMKKEAGAIESSSLSSSKPPQKPSTAYVKSPPQKPSTVYVK